MLGQTDGQTDTVPLHRPRSAYYAGSANKYSNAEKIHVYAVAETGNKPVYRGLQNLLRFLFCSVTFAKLACRLQHSSAPVSFHDFGAL